MLIVNDNIATVVVRRFYFLELEGTSVKGFPAASNTHLGSWYILDTAGYTVLHNKRNPMWSSHQD